MSNRALFHPEHAIQLWCGSCKRLTSSKKWLCSCSQCWMACSIHRPLGFLCKSRLTFKKRDRTGLFQGLDSFRASVKHRRTLPLGERRIHSPLGGWPPPPSPSLPGLPRMLMRSSLPPPSGSPGPPGVAGLPRPTPIEATPELSQTLLIRPQVCRPAGRHVSSGSPYGPGPSSGPGPSAPSLRPLSMPYARPACKIAHSTCVSRTGQCSASGWTIDQYCPKCHG